MTQITISTVHGGEKLETLSIELIPDAGWMVSGPDCGIIDGDIPTLDEAMVVASEEINKLLGGS